MRDDQRRNRDEREEDIEERFDAALDDLFGPDEETGKVIPPPPGESSLPPADTTGGEEVEPVPEEHEPHVLSEGHVFGPDNAPPPPTYGLPTRTQAEPPEPAEPPTMVAGDPAPTGVTPEPQGRNWRKIACIGCLVLVGVPALCLGILIVIGLFVDEEEGTPTPPVGRFADDATADPLAETVIAAAGGLPEPFPTITQDRPTGSVDVLDQRGFGSPRKPVPVGFAAPVGGGWELQINAVTEDANQIVADANMFNDPPAEDRQFLIANVTASRQSEPAAAFDASFDLRLVGASTGSAYTTFEEPDYCGVIPDPFPDTAISAGQPVSGNVCWQVRTDDLRHLMLYRETYTTDPVIWFAVTLDGLTPSAP